jgi:hypothetical protein
MIAPVLMVKLNRTVSGWEVLFNYSNHNGGAIEAYTKYVNQCYPDEWETRFKIVDLETFDKSQLDWLPPKPLWDD